MDSRHTIQRSNQQVGFTTQPVSMTTGDELVYTGLQRELDGYENVSDTLRVVHNPDYMVPEKRSHDYLEILDDSECLPSNSVSFTNRPVSMETEADGYSRPQSQHEGFVGITDYADMLQSQSELNRSVSMEMKEECAYSRPGSQHEGFVGIVDYTDSL